MRTASIEQLSTLSSVKEPGTHQPQCLDYALNAHLWLLLTMIENLKKKSLVQFKVLKTHKMYQE